MRSIRGAVLAALTAVAGFGPAPAAAQTGFGLIGERALSGAERDTIPARGGGQYRELRICIDNAPMQLQEVVVRYRDGGSQALRPRARIRSGGCSRTFSLVGRDRDIQAVELGYAPAAQPAATRPTVQLYAR